MPGFGVSLWYADIHWYLGIARICDPKSEDRKSGSKLSSKTFRMSSSKTAFTKVCHEFGSTPRNAYCSFPWNLSHPDFSHYTKGLLVWHSMSLQTLIVCLGQSIWFPPHCLNTSAIQWWQILAIYTCFSVPLFNSGSILYCLTCSWYWYCRHSFPRAHQIIWMILLIAKEFLSFSQQQKLPFPRHVPFPTQVWSPRASIAMCSGFVIDKGGG